jgi:hypothetical protein
LAAIGGKPLFNIGRGWCYYLTVSQHGQVQQRILAQRSAIADTPAALSAHDVVLSLINHIDADGVFAGRKASFAASGLSTPTSADVHIQCYQRLLDVYATLFDKDSVGPLWGRDFDDAVVAAAFEFSVVVIYTSDGHNVSSVRVSTPRVSGRRAG